VHFRKIKIILFSDSPEFERHGLLQALLVLPLRGVQKYVKLRRFPYVSLQPHFRLRTWQWRVYVISGLARGSGQLSLTILRPKSMQSVTAPFHDFFLTNLQVQSSYTIKF